MTSSFQLRPLIWADKLVAEPEPDQNWVVPGFLERGDRLILTGGEGQGKSTLMRQIGIQAALGINPFTLFPMPRQRVIIMDFENPREATKKELAKICEQAEVEVPGEPWLAIGSWPSGIDLARVDEEILFKQLVKDFSPDLITGGPLYKLTDASLADEQASRALSAALDRLRSDVGFALCIEAHQIQETQAYDNKARKWVQYRAARPFGSSLWRRWPEFGLCLFNDGTLYHWRTDRQQRDWPARLTRSEEPGSWLWHPGLANCAKCDRPLGGKQARYCSDKCLHAAAQQRYRQKASPKVDPLTEELEGL